MRILTCLAVAVAALTSIACGPAPEGGNVYVTESALEGADLDNANANTPVRLVPVVIDADDIGCTIDGVRFGRCTLTPTAGYDGPQDLCDLQTDGGGAYTSACDTNVDDKAVERLREMPWHCPAG